MVKSSQWNTFWLVRRKQKSFCHTDALDFPRNPLKQTGWSGTRVGFNLMWSTPKSLKTWQFTRKYFVSKAEGIVASLTFFTSGLIFWSRLSQKCQEISQNQSVSQTHPVGGPSTHQTRPVTVFDNSNKSRSFICFTSFWCNLEKVEFQRTVASLRFIPQSVWFLSH